MRLLAIYYNKVRHNLWITCGYSLDNLWIKLFKKVAVDNIEKLHRLSTGYTQVMPCVITLKNSVFHTPYYYYYRIFY